MDDIYDPMIKDADGIFPQRDLKELFSSPWTAPNWIKEQQRMERR